jgi:site-specific recombinase XerD
MVNRKKSKRPKAKTILRLPDLEQSKNAVLQSLATPSSQESYCARLCRLAGGELEQIQFLLGHALVETTERYLGCKQKLSHAVNDNLGLADT